MTAVQLFVTSYRRSFWLTPYQHDLPLQQQVYGAPRRNRTDLDLLRQSSVHPVDFRGKNEQAQFRPAATVVNDLAGPFARTLVLANGCTVLGIEPVFLGLQPSAVTRLAHGAHAVEESNPAHAVLETTLCPAPGIWLQE